MTDPQNQEAYRKTLQDSLEEIEDYLTKTEESAEAVSPDKSLGRLSRMEAMQDQQLILVLPKKEDAKSGSTICPAANRKRTVWYLHFLRESYSGRAIRGRTRVQ